MPEPCRLHVYMRTTTIRVPSETRDRLNNLARQRGRTAGEVVDELVREADDRALLAAAEESWRRIGADREALAAYQAETGDRGLRSAAAEALSKPPRQGDVVSADPDPTRGSEQAKPRPFIVVSVDQLNRSPLGLSLVVPTTLTDFPSALHVDIKPPEGGLREKSFAMPEQLRVLSHKRVSKRLGKVRPSTLTELLRRCRLLLRDP